MRLGIVNDMFKKYSIRETAQRIAALGLSCVQLDFKFEGRELDADELTDAKLREIRDAFQGEGLDIVALCGHQKLVRVHEPEWSQGMEVFRRKIAMCGKLGCPLVVTESGSANPENPWVDHPNNEKEEHWAQLEETLAGVVRFAADHGVVFGLEPHFGQLTKTPEKLRRVVDAVNDPNLRVVLDAANMVTAENMGQVDDLLREFFDLLSDRLALVHTKDTRIRDGRSVFVAAGTGVVNYPLLFQLMDEAGYDGPVMLEYVSEAGIPETIDFVKQYM